MFSGTSSLVVTGGNFTFNEPRNATQGESSHLGTMPDKPTFIGKSSCRPLGEITSQAQPMTAMILSMLLDATLAPVSPSLTAFQIG